MSQSTISNVWEDLVVSVLSVNQYTLSNTYKSLQSLEDIGLFKPENLTNWDVDKIEENLKKGGCDRGIFMTGLFAARLFALGGLLSSRGIKEVEAILLSHDKKAIEELLLPVKGIGPKVLQNFFALRKMN